jgi:hypothetical protein
MKNEQQESGYMYCSCRDCFELIIGVPGDMCDECIKAGCEHNQECQSPYAYGCGEELWEQQENE